MTNMAKKKKPKDSDNADLGSLEVTYKAFFQEHLSRRLVRPWQEEEILAFFRDLGLRDKEPSDRYKEALAKF